MNIQGAEATNQALERKGRERSARLGILQEISGFSSIEAFCQATNLKYDTFKSWRSRRTLTAKGAKLISEASQKIGLVVTPEWLLYGYGAAPLSITDDSGLAVGLKNYLENHDQINKSVIAEFLKQNKNGMVFPIDTEEYLPLYNRGDVLLGLWQTGDDLAALNKRNCIVELDNGILDLFEMNIFSLEGKNFCTLEKLMRTETTKDKNQLQKLPSRAAYIFGCLYGNNSSLNLEKGH